MNSHNLANLFTPDYSQLTGLLKFLNAEELKSILNNDERTVEIISDLKQVFSRFHFCQNKFHTNLNYFFICIFVSINNQIELEKSNVFVVLVLI